jgi:pantothenate kinase
MAVVVGGVAQLLDRARRLRADVSACGGGGGGCGGDAGPDAGAGRRRAVLGIAGAPGAGKSMVAALVADTLNADPGCAGTVALLPMDGFHLSGDELAALGLADRKGAPPTFDAAGFVTLLGRIVEEPSRTWSAPGFDRAAEQTVPGMFRIGAEARLVITEGNYLLLDEGAWARVRPLLTEAWFVRVDPEVQYARLIARHLVPKGGRAGAARWVETNDLPNTHVVLATERHADVLVDFSTG